MGAGADAYVTGDIKYHDFFRADKKLLIADIGHYEGEFYIKEIIYNLLNNTNNVTNENDNSNIKSENDELKKQLEKTTKDYNDMVVENKKIYEQLLNANSEIEKIKNGKIYRYANKISHVVKRKNKQ